MRKILHYAVLISVATSLLGLSGCTFIFQKGRRVDVEKISKLKSELSDLERAKAELENQLKSEISNKDVKVEMLEKGLVITFVAEVLFDSGKADLRNISSKTLAKVASILTTTVKDLNIGVEGHTDNIPIKRSGWKSNWELSSGRSLSVVHFLASKGVAEKRISSSCFSEFRPVAANTTAQGRQKNRRVEIVIIPKIEKKGR